MSNLTIEEIHESCLNATQQALERIGWKTISVGILSEEDRERLYYGAETSVLNWQWAMRYYGEGGEEGVLDISLKVIDHESPGALHAVIICKYDERREQFSICMLENFIVNEQTALTGNVLTIALIYATTFCVIVDLDVVYIQDPIPNARPRYRSYGFAIVWNDHSKMSAEVNEIIETIRLKVSGINPDE